MEHSPQRVQSRGHRHFQQQLVRSHFARGLMEADEFSYNLCSKAEKGEAPKLQASLTRRAINVSTNYRRFWETIILRSYRFFFFCLSTEHFTQTN